MLVKSVNQTDLLAVEKQTAETARDRLDLASFRA